MPVRRRPRNPMRPVRRRRFLRRRNVITRNFAKRDRTNKMLLGNLDLGFVDQPITNDTTLNTMFICLNEGQLGSGNYGRLNTRIGMVSLQYMLTVRPQNIVSNNIMGMTFRWGFMIDKQPNGALPPSFGGLATTEAPFDNSLFTLDGTKMLTNLGARGRYIILKDQLGFIGATLIGAVPPLGIPPTTYSRKGYLKLKGLVTEYNNSAAAAGISELVSNALYFFIIAINPASTNNINRYDLSTRIRFTQ